MADINVVGALVGTQTLSDLRDRRGCESGRSSRAPGYVAFLGPTSLFRAVLEAAYYLFGISLLIGFYYSLLCFCHCTDIRICTERQISRVSAERRGYTRTVASCLGAPPWAAVNMTAWERSHCASAKQGVSFSRSVECLLQFDGKLECRHGQRLLGLHFLWHP